MAKTIDLQQSVFDLVTVYPEVADVLYDIGLTAIKTPGMLNTAGRFMTIPKGAKMKKVDLSVIINELQNRGFEVINRDK